MWESSSTLRLLEMLDPYVGILAAFKAIKNTGSLYGNLHRL